VNATDSGKSIAYDASGNIADADINIPAAPGQTESHPTGIVANAKGFLIGSGASRSPSQYVFVTEDGTISGWNPAVDGTHAILTVNRSSLGAVYKGAAIGTNAGARQLFVADFHNARIDVFSARFKGVAMPAGSFKDPNLPAGYAPFNVANVGGQLYVTYAVQDGPKTGDVAGKHHGIVDVFTTAGTFVKRFATGGSLNSPWAVVKAPSNFGTYANDVLVGNFGSGRISVFTPKGRFRGFLGDANAAPITIDGLWGLAFGNGGIAGPRNTLFFAAGPNDEADGLFGKITADAVGTTGGGGGGNPYPY
jgi:uncharacterized protein (TIGR03118 family)